METPRTHPTIHRLILLGVLIAATALIARHREVRSTGRAGIRTDLPERVGAWTGEELVFCQTMKCQATYTRTELAGATACTNCGGALSPGSPVEWALLPKDTMIVKKRYERPDGATLVAAIVLSGADRTSIHRPQICLVGGGQEIAATHARRIPLRDGGDLGVTVLDLLWRGRGPNGQPLTHERFFAYWFVGPGRVTASHWARMFWMGFERIFLGESHRWAYLSISGLREPGAPRHLEALDDFVRDFQPLMLRANAPAGTPDEPAPDQPPAPRD